MRPVPGRVESGCHQQSKREIRRQQADGDKGDVRGQLDGRRHRVILRRLCVCLPFEWSSFLTARGAPPPLALARRLRASLGPQALSIFLMIVAMIRESRANVDGRTIRYLDAGSGWPVVLLHAFPLNADMWRPQLERVPEGWRFIAPDLRGFGPDAAPAVGSGDARSHGR